MARLILQIHQGQFSFRSEYHRALYNQFLKQNEGKEVIVQDNDVETPELRKFFEGAVVPYFYYQHPVAYADFREAREALKKEFNPVFGKDVHGQMTTVGGSTQGKAKRWWLQFLDRIARWFEQNGYEFPESEEYKSWLDHGPAASEVYPPLQRLIDLYDNR